MCLSPLGIAKILLSPEEWEPSTATGTLLISLSVFVIWLYQGLMRVWAGTPEGWENSRKVRPGGQKAGQQQSRSSVLPQAGLSLTSLLLGDNWFEFLLHHLGPFGLYHCFRLPEKDVS